MDPGPPFALYTPSENEITAAADRITRHAGDVEHLNDEVRAAHGPAERGVAGLLAGPMAQAPEPVKRNALSVLQSCVQTAAALTLFGMHVTRYNRGVTALNGEWAQARQHDFGVSPGVEMPEGGRADHNLRAARTAAEHTKRAELIARRQRLEDELNAGAREVRGYLTIGPPLRAELIELYNAGALSDTMLAAFPHINFTSAGDATARERNLADAGRRPPVLQPCTERELTRERAVEAYIGAWDQRIDPLGLPPLPRCAQLVGDWWTRVHANAESRALFQYYLTMAEGLANAGGTAFDAIGIPKEWIIGCRGGDGDKADCARVALAMATMFYAPKGTRLEAPARAFPRPPRPPRGLAATLRQRFDLTPAEVDAIWIQLEQYGPYPSPSQRLAADPRAAQLLDRALDKMPTYEGNAYLTVDGLDSVERFVAPFVPGQRMTESNFVLAHRTERGLLPDHDVYFIIEGSRTARDTSAFGAQAMHGDVWFKPGTTFDVLSREFHSGDRLWVIRLREAG